MTTNLASLRRWRPRTWNGDGETFETFDTTAETGETGQAPVLVDMDEILENRNLVTLWRAAEHSGLAKRLFNPEPRLAGTGWYDNLERIIGMSVECRIGEHTFTLEHEREFTQTEAVRKTLDHGRVESITVNVTLRRKEKTRSLRIDTDFAVADEYDSNPLTAGIIFRGDFGRIDIDKLSELIHDAVFVPGEDDDDDSIRTQLEDSREDAHYAACKLLLDHSTAETERIRYSIQHRVAHLIPEGRSVRIIKHPGIETVEVKTETIGAE